LNLSAANGHRQRRNGDKAPRRAGKSANRLTLITRW